MFWTAGKGAIAQLRTQTKAKLELALDVLDDMPQTTEATAKDRSLRFDFRTQAAASPIELNTASRGLYVYDHLDQHRRQTPPDPHLYVRLARP